MEEKISDKELKEETEESVETKETKLEGNKGIRQIRSFTISDFNSKKTEAPISGVFGLKAKPEVKDKSEILLNAKLKTNTGEREVNVTQNFITWKGAKGKDETFFSWDLIILVARKKDRLNFTALLPSHSIPPSRKAKKKDFFFLFPSEDQATEWYNKIKPLVYPNGTDKKFKIFINPFSGTKTAPKIWASLAHYFEEAGITCEVIETKKRNHAFDECKTMDLSNCSGIISVSGDGLFFEILNGLLSRNDWRAAMKIPLGIIPGGTGNSLSCSIGIFGDPVIAALYLIKGYTTKLDIIKCVQAEETHYSFLNLSWGFAADIDIESEKYRFMGPLRLTVGTLARIISLRRYKGRLCYLPVAEGTQFQPVDIDSLQIENIPTHRDFAHPPEGWTVIEDEFIVFIASNVSHLTVTQPVAPKAQLADGCIDLVLIRASKLNGRVDLVKAMSEMEPHGKHINDPRVEYIKLKAYTLEPGNNLMGSGGQILDLDGEKIKYEPISCENICGLATIFAFDFVR